LLIIAIPLNFAWEMLQASSFTGMPPDALWATVLCAQAAVGDGVIALGLCGLGAWAFGDPRWFMPTRLRRYVMIVGIAVAVQVLNEWVMVYGLGRWGYDPVQPLVPGLGVGLLPVLQAVMLVPLTFGTVAWWESR
jgi:hypothetical protein